MTKKEENPQNSNTSFKLKLTKIREIPQPQSLIDKLRPAQDLYNQRLGKSNFIPYNKGKFSLESLKESLQEVFMQPQERKVKIVMNEGAKKLFDQALMKELKNYNKNEYRKGLSFKSKIFKQTYKFG